MIEFKFYDFITELSFTTSINAKKAILKRYANDASVTELLLYTYNPYWNYYVTKPELTGTEDGTNVVSDSDLALFKEILNRANSRSFTPRETTNALQKLASKFCYAIADTLNLVVTRDLKCGINIKTINSVIKPSKNEDFIPYFTLMRAQKIEGKIQPKYPCYVSDKLDGYRSIAIYDEKVHSYSMYSVEGRYFESYTDRLAAALNKLENELYSYYTTSPLIDGEVMSNDYAATASARAKDKNSGIKFYIFDILANFEDPTTAQYRYKTLEYVAECITILGLQNYLEVVPHVLVHNEAELEHHYNTAVANGKEGIMVTDPNSVYERKRTISILKKKPVNPVDATILEILPGKVGTALEHTAGSVVIAGIDENGIEFKCNCGSGISRKNLDYLWQHRIELVGKIAEFKYDCITQDKDTGEYALRFPRFVKIRTDKTV